MKHYSQGWNSAVLKSKMTTIWRNRENFVISGWYCDNPIMTGMICFGVPGLRRNLFPLVVW